QAPMAWTPPSTWTISPVVAGNQSDSNAATARATGSGSPMSHPNAARADHISSKCSNPGMLFAAIVRTGPAATRFTRIPAGPRSRARYRAVDSNADFATPIQSYTGHAWVLSKSSPTIDPPSAMSGNAATANAFNENAEICNASATSSHG